MIIEMSFAETVPTNECMCLNIKKMKINDLGNHNITQTICG